LVAQNAHSESVFFESFEYEYTSGRDDGTIDAMCFDALRILEDECDLNTTEAHSGSNSLEIRLTSAEESTEYEQTISLTSYASTSTWTVTTQMLNQGISVKVWVKSSNDHFPTLNLQGGYEEMVSVSDGMGDYVYVPSFVDVFSGITFTALVQTGEWKLYEAKVEADDWIGDASTISSMSLDINIEYSTSSTPPIIYLDDIRMQPLDAQMNCFVYDPATFKVLTSFDDQHFGLYYQYNDEGKLIRKMKETVRGLKTIVETQYNIPTVER
jgi:hypothetical protein